MELICDFHKLMRGIHEQHYCLQNQLLILQATVTSPNNSICLLSYFEVYLIWLWSLPLSLVISFRCYLMIVFYAHSKNCCLAGLLSCFWYLRLFFSIECCLIQESFSCPTNLLFLPTVSQELRLVSIVYP